MQFSKPTKIRSKKIRDSARGESCTLRIPGVCSFNPEKVMLCHINSRFKGMGNKSHDIHSYYGCYPCHMEEQAYRVEAKDLLRAMIETQDRMIQKGLIEVK